ncbi:hypothetical protein B0T21DRAFT_56857 [Apiosordaria backusii]|uniref:Uncharacterized protein n=1 Tax=Apiosordaria backusii TaxID=314023 RepID=A0AA40DYX5_9PEZI|nr:hypothetical protein B0T21DRAFT_56857 [Apiosordaria backusii]
MTSLPCMMEEHELVKAGREKFHFRHAFPALCVGHCKRLPGVMDDCPPTRRRHKPAPMPHDNPGEPNASVSLMMAYACYCSNVDFHDRVVNKDTKPDWAACWLCLTVCSRVPPPTKAESFGVAMGAGSHCEVHASGRGEASNWRACPPLCPHRGPDAEPAPAWTSPVSLSGWTRSFRSPAPTLPPSLSSALLLSQISSPSPAF